MGKMKFDLVEGMDEYKGAFGAEMYYLLEASEHIVLLSGKILTKESLESLEKVVNEMGDMLNGEVLQMCAIACAFILKGVKNAFYRDVTRELAEDIVEELMGDITGKFLEDLR